MQTKKCIKCEKEKPLDEFQIRKEKRGKPGKRRNECKECTKKYKKERYYIKHAHNMSVKKKYRENPKNKESRRKWDKDRRENNVQYKLSVNLRNRLNRSMKNEIKSGSAVSDLGCSIEELKQYLEKQFYANPETGEMMTWKNWGRTGWHIDHIKPLSSFDLANKKQFKKACHYTNLQPLWYKDNIKKGGIKSTVVKQKDA